MAVRSNPFKPGFGNSPAVLAGRDDIVAQFAESLDNGPGALGRATLYTGTRGAGKTVMLNEAADVARQRGWLVVEETASHGFVRRPVGQHLPAMLAELDPKAHRVRFTGAAAPLGWGRLDWETLDAHDVEAGLRNQLEQVCSLLATQDTGLLVTLDEVHLRQDRELRDFFVAVQHLFRNDQEIAVVAAGLPSAVSSLLNDHVLTFLRRADRHVLGRVGLGEVSRAITATVEGGGRSIAPDVARLAADATGGYPFLIQLVGYSVWRQRPDADDVVRADVESGVPEALARMGRLVHEPALADLSDVDRAFLQAMAIDHAPSRVADLAERLGVEGGYISVYRRRLIDAQLIEPAGRGAVRFTLPYLAEHLRLHADSAPALPRKAS